MNIVVVDSDVKGDYRVESSLKNDECYILDIRNSLKNISSVIVLFFLLRFIFEFLLGLIKSYKILYKKIGPYVQDGFFSGSSAVFKLILKSIRASYSIKLKINSNSDPVKIHAHDLYCGVAAALAKNKRCYLIYDAHELEINRNRKAGWLRVLFEFYLEKFVLNRADELVLVNYEIKKIMAEWYKLPDVIRVVYNDFYDTHSIAINSFLKKPCIIYVGKGVRGRCLENLDNDEVSDFFDVYAFLLGSKLPTHIKGDNWICGNNDYEEELIKLMRDRFCFMWCCLEKTCLSYVLATPNKFFQALAIGMPILASKGTYIADIVEKYDLGLIYEGQSFEMLYFSFDQVDYKKWVQNVIDFRGKMKRSEILI